MWGIWRVYNTRQDGVASTDGLPSLLPLPDRRSALSVAVPARALVGTTVKAYDRSTEITADNLDNWVAGQLPPAGVPKGYDASVWDWHRLGGTTGESFVGEKEPAEAWPGYQSRQPGKRLELLFDPRTGRLAYPFLRPHLGARPPFAPNHGPTPFLDDHAGPDPPKPGANGAGSLCPKGTTPRQFAINAIATPVPRNAAHQTIDGQGLLFVMRSQEAQARKDPKWQVPLAIRANAGEDCVDVLLRNEIPETANLPFSKVGLHIHFVQFDVQASDGLDAGFNYEQTVRPYTLEGTKLSRVKL